MKVRMLETAPGAPDGLRSFQYEAGREYDECSRPPMTDALADVLIRGGLAVEVKPASDESNRAPEMQAHPGAPEKQATRRGKKAEQ